MPLAPTVETNSCPDLETDKCPCPGPEVLVEVGPVPYRFTLLACCDGGLLRSPTSLLMLCIAFRNSSHGAFVLHECSSERGKS